jgi:hypothetical protein
MLPYLWLNPHVSFIWTASSKQGAKHEAAYEAIKDAYPELLEIVVYDDVVYNPECLDRNSNPLLSSFSQPELKKKC